LDYRVGGAATAAVLAALFPAFAGFGAALPTLRLTVMPLGSATFSPSASQLLGMLLSMRYGGAKSPAR
jgi:hypothetical protein